MRVAWVDASAGAAGDMLLAALVDAGAPLESVQDAVASVVGDRVRLAIERVTRHGIAATHLHVDADGPDEERHLSDIITMIESSGLSLPVQRGAVAVFRRLAVAEASVHGADVEEVHFHEVGALDSIADIVGVVAALDLLGIDEVHVGDVEVGSGSITGSHGVIPVPTPAVLALATDWRLTSRRRGECTTPTAMALLTELGTNGAMPALRVEATGVGAGSRDDDDRANVVRVVIGDATTGALDAETMLLEANVDDMDPRLWPGAIAGLMAAGALDAWLTPITMKKGRPAQVVSVLCHIADHERLAAEVFRLTTTIGLRYRPIARHTMERQMVQVQVHGHPVRGKAVFLEGRMLRATAEFEDVAALAVRLGLAEREVMAEADARLRALAESFEA